MDRTYKEVLAGKVEKAYSNLELQIMEDIVRRIKKAGEITSTADYQINKLQLLGNSSEDIEKMMKEALNASYPQMFELYDQVIDWEYVRNKDIYDQVNAEFVPYEDNEELQQITDGLRRQTQEELENITRTTGFALDYGKSKLVFTPLSEIYQGYLDAAMMDIVSGAFDYNSVLRKVVTQMTNSGLRTVDYASGRSFRVNVAARMAVMTGITQLTGEISEMNAEALGTDSFEVAWHANARPTHAVWQGRVWTKEQLRSVCGLGTVTGLCGANCYHEYYPFVPGASERQWSDEWLDEQSRKENEPKSFKGKEYTAYEATQRQRQMETAMRAQREKVKLLEKGGADSDDVMLAKCKYQGQLQEYSAFSKKMGLKTQRDRIYLDGNGRVAPSKESVKSIVKNNKSDIMKAESELGKFKRIYQDDKNIDKDYYSVIKNKFSNGSDDAKKVFNKFINSNSVSDGNYFDVPNYNPKTKKIKMNYIQDMNNSRGNGVTWFHEHGHLIDDVGGNISKDNKFLTLLQEDSKQYRLSYGKKHGLNTWDKVDNAISQELCDMRKHSGVSDIFQGISNRNINGCAGHPLGYWNNTSIKQEAFAHMFEAQFDFERYGEMKKYFPESLRYFEEKIKEAAK